MTSNVDRLSADLDAAFARTPDVGMSSGIMGPLLRLLSRGVPVSADELAMETGREPQEVRELLPRLPSVEIDEQGRVVGSGLTLNPTRHRFIVGAHADLYTWCALDTLVFPNVLGQSAQVESPCHGTGETVRVSVGPQGVNSLEPATSVVSILVPSSVSGIRSSFCNHVHFFASEDAASAWLAEHPGASLLPVAEAFELGRRVARSWLSDVDGATWR
jgi:alkylmercury lyase